MLQEVEMKKCARFVYGGLTPFLMITALAGCQPAADFPAPAATPPVQQDANEPPAPVKETPPVKEESQKPFAREPGPPDPVYLTASPADPADIAHIFPLGLMSGSHVTPVDHQYYYWAELDVPPERYLVYSPADGFVVSVQYLESDYIVFIEHSADVQTEFIHLEKLVGPLSELEGKVTWGNSARVRIQVRAGEVIAHDGGTNGFDFSVHDYSMTLPGFVNPESYVAEPWKLHTADPYDYFIEPVRSRLLEKNVRRVEPLGGKIDYDIRGRLSGNWFVEGTNGYAGISRSEGPILPDQQKGYWNTHLAVAPDPVDPSAYIVSLGEFMGGTAQLAILDPNPPPAEVSPATGLEKYELADWFYVFGEDGEQWHGVTRMAEPDIRLALGVGVRATVLFQLIDDDHLRMEVFPGKTAVEVTAFSGQARVYVR